MNRKVNEKFWSHICLNPSGAILSGINKHSLDAVSPSIPLHSWPSLNEPILPLSPTQMFQPLDSEPRCSSKTCLTWVSASTCLMVSQTYLPPWPNSRDVLLQGCWPEPLPWHTLSAYLAVCTLLLKLLQLLLLFSNMGQIHQLSFLII